MQHPSTDLKKFIRELFGGFLLLCSLLLLIGLLTYDAADPSLNHIQSGAVSPHNKAGLFGAYAAGFLDDIFGLGAIIWPCIFAVLGVVYLSSRLILCWWRWTGFFLLTICFMVCASALNLHLGDLGGGGIIGTTLDAYATRYLSPFGSFLLWLFIGLTGLQLAANISWTSLLQTGLSRLHAKIQACQTGKKASGLLRSTHFFKLPSLPPYLQNIKQLNLPAIPLKAAKVYDWLKNLPGKNLNLKKFRLPASQPGLPLEEDEPFAPCQELQPRAAIIPSVLVKPEEIPSDSATISTPSPDAPPVMDERELQAIPAIMPQTDAYLAQPEHPQAQSGQTAQSPATPCAANKEVCQEDAVILDQQPVIMPNQHPSSRLFTDKTAYELPTSDLLEKGSPLPPASPENLAAKGEALMKCFQDFDIHGVLARITPGPVVTMFEVRPAPGIRVSKIANLSDDLSLALKAMAVRIQAPIPGSDTVGIEIPNEQRETVNFRELVESADFAKSEAPLTMILGKTIAGHPFMADLAKMPHMLVAGATGAGKSVCLNSILISLLFQHAPDGLRLLLIDPKRIEMAVYSDLPHLVHPVVTEMDDAKNALDWAVQEMENRFKTFMRLGVRNISAYHSKLRAFGASMPENLSDLGRLPYMVIVIDELADLMLTAAREVEPKIQRLAQLARAAGIHMILATQRPSVDVVTGLIKAQFPCRISFQVSSKHDSRTILDQVGAEHLLGRGDMLFKPPGARLLRLHGPFVSDEEVQAVVQHWKAQSPPDYQVDFSQWGSESASSGKPTLGSDAADDPLYQDARDFVLAQGRISISLLQRHLRIGFTRSARIVEQLEKDGIIGPADGSKPRTVIR